MKRIVFILLALSLCGCKKEIKEKEPRIVNGSATSVFECIEVKDDVYFYVPAIYTSEGVHIKASISLKEKLKELQDKIQRLEEYLEIEEVNEYKPEEEKTYYKKKKESK